MKNIYIINKKKYFKYKKDKRLLGNESMNKKRKEHKRYFKAKKKLSFKFKYLIPFFLFSLLVFIFLKTKAKNKSKKNYFKNNNTNNNYFACFVGMGRQENKYIREIIDYYSKLGVEKFILADNNLENTEKFSDVIQDHIDNGLVDIKEIFGSDMGQSELYKDTYEKYRNQCKWFLLFDLDEFLEVHFEKDKSLTLKEFLTNVIFNKCEAILFNWVIYGDNELIHYDNRSVVERFTEAYFEDRDNHFVKSILRGGLNKTVFVPKKSNHVPERGVTICDSKGDIRESYNAYNINPPIFDYGYLKHFTTKTAEEYCEKIIRGQPRNMGYDPAERVQCFFLHNRFSEEKLKVFENKFNRTFNPIINRNDFRGDE